MPKKILPANVIIMRNTRSDVSRVIQILRRAKPELVSFHGMHDNEHTEKLLEQQVDGKLLPEHFAPSEAFFVVYPQRHRPLQAFPRLGRLYHEHLEKLASNGRYGGVFTEQDYAAIRNGRSQATKEEIEACAKAALYLQDTMLHGFKIQGGGPSYPKSHRLEQWMPRHHPIITPGLWKSFTRSLATKFSAKNEKSRYISKSETEIVDRIAKKLPKSVMVAVHSAPGNPKQRVYPPNADFRRQAKLVATETFKNSPLGRRYFRFNNFGLETNEHLASLLGRKRYLFEMSLSSARFKKIEPEQRDQAIAGVTLFEKGTGKFNQHGRDYMFPTRSNQELPRELARNAAVLKGGLDTILQYHRETRKK